MRLVFISDTHQLHDRIGTLPDGDVPVHCGDFTNKGTEGALRTFLSWFVSQPHERKILIPGNHELGMDKGPMRSRKLAIVKEFTDQHSNLSFLENEEITINGVKFYGSPVTPWFLIGHGMSIEDPLSQLFGIKSRRTLKSLLPMDHLTVSWTLSKKASVEIRIKGVLI